MAGLTAQRVSHYREISGSEMAKIFAAIGQESLYAQVFLLFCIVCGYSAAYVQTLQWNDLEPGEEGGETEPGETAAIATTTTQRGLTVSQLSPILVRRLYQLPRRGTAVFHPHREDGCFWSPQNARLYWGRVCRRAQMPTIKLRDVRYTWAQWMAGEDSQCRHLDLVLDRATVQMYQTMQPPVPMKTVRNVPWVRKPIKPIIRRIES